jgi:hypothetical protein
MPDSHDLREKQSKPDTTPRQPSDSEILRARPVGGKIDQAELTAKIIARFPKILAVLAK